MKNTVELAAEFIRRGMAVGEEMTVGTVRQVWQKKGEW